MLLNEVIESLRASLLTSRLTSLYLDQLAGYVLDFTRFDFKDVAAVEAGGAAAVLRGPALLADADGDFRRVAFGSLFAAVDVPFPFFIRESVPTTDIPGVIEKNTVLLTLRRSHSATNFLEKASNTRSRRKVDDAADFFNVYSLDVKCHTNEHFKRTVAQIADDLRAILVRPSTMHGFAFDTSATKLRSGMLRMLNRHAKHQRRSSARKFQPMRDCIPDYYRLIRCGRELPLIEFTSELMHTSEVYLLTRSVALHWYEIASVD